MAFQIDPSLLGYLDFSAFEDLGNIRVLSVQQPWAYLIFAANKDIENRNWWTKYRGTILIHASKKRPKNEHLNTIEQVYKTEIERDRLWYGAIIGKVDLVDIVTNSESFWAEEDQYHWVLKNAVSFHKFFFCKGKLGLWTLKEIKY